METVRPRPEQGQEIDPPSRRRLRSTARGQLARPPKPHRESPHPAVYLDASALLAQRPFIRSALRARGVRAADLDDVTQETVLGAFCSMRAGRFRPSPDQPPGDALRAWLAAVALRQASHHRDKAYRRHEVPAVDPDRLAPLAAPSPEERIVARGLLRAFHRLRAELREVLALTAAGLTTREIAAALAIPRPTVATRLRLARRLFARSLTRARRWPR
ncbi:sigma-70 family RNA polymerase sigma factor [Sorangium sp. So ce145]|uniref:sigma-70 family RNA polymerase sigma factor n=1 Tax=Sorangium sp. So ce145 TaxID=3133285 RepID=UPI003F6017C9